MTLAAVAHTSDWQAGPQFFGHNKTMQSRYQNVFKFLNFLHFTAT
jgi:hypothetical protein